jgi:hypothetical protein
MEELNLSDSDFYKYIGVSSDSSTEMINKNLRQFYLKIHPDKCNLDNLRQIFGDNNQILNLINSVSTNPADKDSDRQSICTKLYQLFSNKWESLQANSGEEMSDEEGVADNQFTETFNDSVNAQLSLQLVDFNTLNFYDIIINYIEANPSVTLSQDEINQIMYLLQKFVYDNKDNLLLFQDYPLPQQPLVQKGGSLNILLITLIFIFISSLFVSVQGKFLSDEALIRSTKLIKTSFDDDVTSVVKQGQSILQLVSVLTGKAKEPVRNLVKKTTGKVFDAIGTQVQEYTDKLDSDNTILRESMVEKINTKKAYEAQLRNPNNRENPSHILAQIEALGYAIKEDSLTYSQSVLFKSVINTLLGKRIEKLDEEQSVLFETIKTGVSYVSIIPTVGANTNVLIVDSIEQIFYRFFSELQDSGVMKIPEKTTSKGIYDSYIRDYVPFVASAFEDFDVFLDKIDVSKEQAGFVAKYTADTIGSYDKGALQVGVENYVINQIEKNAIPQLISFVSPFLGAPTILSSVGVVLQACSIFDEATAARLTVGHRLHLVKNVVKSAVPLLNTLKNVRIEGSYEERVTELTGALMDRKLSKSFSLATGIISSLVYTKAQGLLFPTSTEDVQNIDSSMKVTYINNFGTVVTNPVYKGLLQSGKLKVNNGNVSLNDLINSINGLDFGKYSTGETTQFFEFVLGNMEEVYKPNISNFKSVTGITRQPLNYLSDVLGLKEDSKTDLNKITAIAATELAKKTISQAKETFSQANIEFNASSPQIGEVDVDLVDVGDIIIPNLIGLGKQLGINLKKGLGEYNSLEKEFIFIGGIRYKKYTNTKNRKNKYNKTKKINKKMPKTNSKKKFKKNKKNLKKSKKNKKY